MVRYAYARSLNDFEKRNETPGERRDEELLKRREPEKAVSINAGNNLKPDVCMYAHYV